MPALAESEVSRERQDRITAAREFEGDGRIINEWYTVPGYIQRRAGFLSKHPDYKHIATLFIVVKRDADLVFESDTSVLSCQQVRQRELDLAIDTLLPFVTSSNTETLDDYGAYPESEWVPGTQINTGQVFPSSPIQQHTTIINAVEQPRASTAPPTSTTARRIDTASSSQDQASPAARPKSLASASHPGDSLDPSTLSASVVFANVSDKAFRHSDMSPAVTSPDAQNAPNMPWLTRVLRSLDSNPEEFQAKLSRNQRSSMPPPSYAADEGVAAVSNRPVQVPVKLPGGIKRASRITPPAKGRTQLPSKGTETNPLSETGPRGTKRRAEEIEDDIPPSPPPIDREPSPSKKIKPSDDKSKCKQSTRPPSGATMSNPRLRRIASGEILPHTHKEAFHAQSVRRQILLSSFQDSHPRKKSRGSPDLMPEFFSPDNFSAAERDDPVRCLCGATRVDTDTKEEWIGCDGERCGGVWQHVRCLGDAVDPDQEVRESAAYEYLCQMCDPLRHRRGLQRLRKGE